MNGEQHWTDAQSTHGYEIFERVVGQRWKEVRIEREGTLMYQEQRITLSGLLQCRLCADGARGAPLMVDDYRLSQYRAQFFSDPPSSNIRGRSGKG